MDNLVIVIDVYRFCTTVYELLKWGAKKVYVTNDRFLPRRMKEYDSWKDLITFGESKGIKLPWTDYDNSPLDIKPEEIKDRRCMVRSSMGARMVEKAVKQGKEVMLGCMRNFPVYINSGVTDIRTDDHHDEYCKGLIRGEHKNRAVERGLMTTARDEPTAFNCYIVDDAPFKVGIRREAGTNLLEAYKI